MVARESDLIEKTQEKQNDAKASTAAAAPAAVTQFCLPGEYVSNYERMKKRFEDESGEDEDVLPEDDEVHGEDENDDVGPEEDDDDEEDEDYVPEEDEDDDCKDCNDSGEEYDNAPDEDGDEGDRMFYPGVMSALDKIVNNLRQQQQTASDPAWDKAAPFLRFVRNKLVAAGVPQLPPYMSSSLLDSFVTGCGWDPSDNAAIDEASAPPSAKQLLSVFEQAYKDTLKFCDDVAMDLVSRARDLADKGSADTANMVKLATQAVQLMKVMAETHNRIVLIEESKTLLVECDVLAAIVEWRDNPADQNTKAPDIAKRLETAMDKLFGTQSRPLVRGCPLLADFRMQECGLMLVKVWKAMGETDQANALGERLEAAKKRREQLDAVMDSW